MAATTAPRKIISIYDYPEHLNPFREDDNYKQRFWTIGRKQRSNSISFSGIKDIKNSWAFRSFMKKGKNEKQAARKPINGESSPIVYRRALQQSSASAAVRSTLGSPERADHYMYNESTTPLPRSRFQERLRSTSQHEVNSLNKYGSSSNSITMTETHALSGKMNERYEYGGSLTPLPRSRFQDRLRRSQQDAHDSLSLTPRMARSEITGSRLSMESTNPFEDGPLPPVRVPRKKKKKAPPPPPLLQTEAENEKAASSIVLKLNESAEEKKTNADPELGDVSYSVELKIVEDEDVTSKMEEVENTITNIKNGASKEITYIDAETVSDDVQVITENRNSNDTKEEKLKKSDSDESILNKINFPKVDITKYRRNSSLNEDDIRLRRGNLEDFHTISTKRSKSLNNGETYLIYDENIILHDKKLKDNNANNLEPKKVVCTVSQTSRKHSLDNSVSSTEKEFLEIDKATRELEKEIRKLNWALDETDIENENTLSVSSMKRRFEKTDIGSPNPIPKPRRSYYGETNSINGKVHL